MPQPRLGCSFNRLTAINTQHSRVQKEVFSNRKGKHSFLSQNAALALDSQRRPAVVDQAPDGGIVIELYQAVRTVRNVEAANDYVKAQIIKAQSIVAAIARLHAATFKSRDGSEAPQVEAIGCYPRAVRVA